MQTPWLSWLPWLLVAAGAALGAPYLLRVLRASLNAEAFTAVVRKLLDARNADRAVKLTRAASDSPLAAATRAAILACGQGVAQTDASADYRSAGDLSPERVLAPVRARYDEAFEAQAAPVRYARYAAIPGALMLVAALSSGTPATRHAPGGRRGDGPGDDRVVGEERARAHGVARGELHGAP
ncbi:MAG: hypothetical protein IPF99_20595 [Deltaproteobacteria bacterium]|nr:hypothetical protein [Deltaproteobacteria bacterium]